MLTTANVEEQKSTRRRRVLFALAIAAVLAAAPALGYILVFIQPSNDWFVQVNDQEIKRSILVEMLQTEKREAARQGRSFDLTARAFGIAGELTEDEVLRQQAHQFGGLPTDDAIDVRIRRLVVPTDSDGSLIKVNQAEFKELQRTHLEQRGLSEESFRRQAAASIVRSQAKAILSATIPSTQPQIHVHRILTTDAASADFVLQRAEAGTSFEQLATDYSLVNDGGDLGWLPYDALPAHIADYLWNVEPFKMSLPVEEPTGAIALYVVSARDTARPVDPSHIPIIEQRTFDSWMNSFLNDQEINVQIDSNMLAWLATEMAKTRIP